MNRESTAILVALTDPATPRLRAGLVRFTEEAGPHGEVLLVDASGTSEGAEIASRFANVRVLPGPAGRLAPTLWRDGLLATEADFVALTTAQMIPGQGWIKALKARMAETGAAGVGGPIEPASGLSKVDRAVALLRYASYFPDDNAPSSSPLPPGEGPGVRDVASPVAGTIGSNGRHPTLHDPHPGPLLDGEGGRWGTVQPPGDNALYRRDLLRDVRSSWLDGFWEVEVHQALRDRGQTLAMADRAIVAFHGGLGLASMSRQRFRHARRYAIGRSAAFGPRTRFTRSLATPLVPPLLCLRAFRSLRSRGMPLSPWLPSFPALAWLASSWAIGEALGTWQGGTGDPVDGNDFHLNKLIKEAA